MSTSQVYKAYYGTFIECTKDLEIDVEVVSREPDQIRFQTQPRRWVVERTFA